VKRLRHPIRAIREPFGTAGLIIAMIALVAALGGSALAASGALTGKQKKEVEKIAKKYAGKPGAAGPTGPAGANGKDGANGANGTTGAAGKDGAAGAAGKSVKVAAASPLHCSGLGGVTVEEEGNAASAKDVCNGAKGDKGEPWTPNSQLPVGATETGAWVFFVNESAEEEVYVSLSFPVPLIAALGPGHVHFESEANFHDFDGLGSEEVGCKGTTGVPSAPSGNLCVYGNTNVENATFKAIKNVSAGASENTSTSGALLIFDRGPTGEAYGSGSFAVTG
jgi:hypothetical protein